MKLTEEIQNWIKSKKSEFDAAVTDGKIANDKAWSYYVTEMASGFMMGLSKKQIEGYLDYKYSIPQMEVLKFAQFADIPLEDFINMANPELSPEEMRDRLLKSPEKASLSAVMASIKSFMDEMSAFKEEVAAYRNELQKEPAAEPDCVSGAETQPPEQGAEPEQKQPSVKTEKEEAEIKRLSDELIDYKKKLLSAEAEIKRLSAELEKQPEPAVEPEKKTIFNKKQNINFRVQPLPADFSLESYIAEQKSLTKEKMEVITYAISIGMHESIIKQMIDSKKDAEQLKYILEIIVAKTAADKRKAAAAAASRDGTK